jgi:hypothetical protein
MGVQIETHRFFRDHNLGFLAQVVGEQLGRPVRDFYTNLMRVQFNHPKQLRFPCGRDRAPSSWSGALRNCLQPSVDKPFEHTENGRR